mgnify:CR=1 FL=1
MSEKSEKEIERGWETERERLAERRRETKREGQKSNLYVYLFFSIFVFLLLLDNTDYMNQKLPAKNRKLVYVYTYLPHQNMLSLEIRIKNVSSRYVTIYRISYVSTTVQKDK